MSKGRCPFDGTKLTEIGSAGIVDPENRWDAETTRYRCSKDHMIFVAKAARIDMAEGIDELGIDVWSDA